MFTIIVCAAIQAFGQTADEIIEKYTEARGGYEKIKAVKTIRLTGKYEEGEDKFDTYIEWKRPFFRVVVIGIPNEFYREAYNGQAWEYLATDGILKITKGAAADAARRGAEFDESIIDYRSKGHTVEYVGREKLQGRDVFHLKVKLNDGWLKHYYIEAKSHLIVALRKSMPFHAKGDDIESLSTFEDYKPVKGVLYPHRFVTRKTATGEVMSTLRWEKIETNVPLDDRQFYPPVGVFKKQ